MGGYKFLDHSLEQRWFRSNFNVFSHILSGSLGHLKVLRMVLNIPGRELYWDNSLSFMQRWYCRIFGVPIIGLRIRLRVLNKLLPNIATHILDAGCGRGVMTRSIAIKYPHATVHGVDENPTSQAINRSLSTSMGLENCKFIVENLASFRCSGCYDLIVSIDNLEHIQDDRAVLKNFYESMSPNGLLLVHVPHYYRRWPVFRLVRNFDVPGHVRPGYHLPELTERVRGAGFQVLRSGFSYGWLENLINNISYVITGARERNRALYAGLFPLLNLIAWFGQWGWPRVGAGVWLVAEKSAHSEPPVADDKA